MTLGRSSIVILTAIVFVGMAAMFGLGHYAGRRQGPIMYDYQDMRGQFSDIKQALSTIELRKGQQRSRPTDLTKEAGDNTGDHLLYTPSEAAARDYTPRSVSSVAQPALKFLSEMIKSKDKLGASKPEDEKAESDTARADAASVTPGAAESLATWTVQVAAVTSADEADRLVGLLLKKGYPAWAMVIKRPGKDDIHRVRVGRYGNRPKAEMVRKALSETSAESLVVKIE